MTRPTTPTPAPMLARLPSVALMLLLGASLGGLARASADQSMGLRVALAASASLTWLALRSGRLRSVSPIVLISLCVASALWAAGPRGRSDLVEWQPRGQRPDLGPLGEGELQVPAGFLRRGDLVAIRSVQRPLPVPQATVPSPAPRLPRWQVLPDELRVLQREATWTLAGLPASLRRTRAKLQRRLKSLRDPFTRGLCLSLVTGERSELPPGATDRFVRTGTRHLLALSGLHLVLFTGLIGLPLARLLSSMGTPRKRALRMALFTSLALLSALVVGGSAASLQRATWALLPALWAPLLPAARRDGPPVGRRIHSANLLALALLLQLGGDPRSIASLSVQLSYGATAALLAFGFAVPGSATEAARPLHWIERLRRRCSRAVVRALYASWVATLATLPVTWCLFGEVSLVGILATPILVLPISFMIVLGWAFALVPLAGIEGWLELSARLIDVTLQAADSLPGTPWSLPPRPPEWIVPGCLAGLLWARTPGMPRRIACFCLGSALLPWISAARGLEVHLFDVGHGTCVVLRAPGPTTVIFDAGSRSHPGLARSALGPALRHWEVARPRVVVSHLDRDHTGALPWLWERYPPTLLAGACQPAWIDRLSPATLRLDLARGSCRLPNSSPRVPLELHLVRGGPFLGNEGSRSLIVHWGGQRLLLCGDAEEDGLAGSLRSGDVQGPFAAVLLPHHGVDGPEVRRLLESAGPEAFLWVSSAGQPELFPAIEAAQLPLHWTARDGPLRWLAGTAPAGIEPAQEDGFRPIR